MLPALLPLAPALLLHAPTCLAADTQLVAPGATWTFLDTGVDPGTTFADPAFDDTLWATGPAPLGYGMGTEATVVSFGPDPNDKHITTWFRHDFSVADASLFTELAVRVQRDDGVVVYLNGVEQVRDSVPAGAIDASTRASITAQEGDELLFFELPLLPTDLVTGANTLAVELHQASKLTSDARFDLELVGRDGPPTAVRGPYLGRAAPDGMVVRWRTLVATDSVVRVGSAPGLLTTSFTDPTVTTEHEVALTGLAPDTTWFYSVGDSAAVHAGDDPDHSFRTSPPLGTQAPARVWVVGDSGTANHKARAVRDAFLLFSPTSPDLFVLLGDNAYDDGTDWEYERALFDVYPSVLRTTPAFPTLGNHDARSADSPTGTGPYYDGFTLPAAGESGGVPSGTEAYYSYDYANVHFISLDSHDSERGPGGPMLTWLEADLTATTQDWIVAYWHHPPYSKGSHNSDTEGRLVQMRVSVLPILEDYGVDLVLSGHSHSYERSFLLDGHYTGSALFDPLVHAVDAGDGREAGTGAYRKPSYGPAAHEGAVYVVAGSSGKTTAAALDHPAMVVSALALGSVILDFAGYRLDATFLDDTGGIADSFTLLKGADCTLPDHDDDLDGLCSSADLCPDDSDPGQEDSDGDGSGDACDPCPLDAADDPDGDGACEDVDNCPGLSNPGQEDGDGDGAGDACDPCFDGVDTDGDGTPDSCDLCPGFPDTVDTDGDGIPDGCDAVSPLLAGPFPGLAGIDNGFSYTQGAPLQPVYLVGGTVLGAAPVPGCPALDLAVVPMSTVALGPADLTGSAGALVAIPAAAAGQLVYFQAVQPDACVASPPSLWPFP